MQSPRVHPRGLGGTTAWDMGVILRGFTSSAGGTFSKQPRKIVRPNASVRGAPAPASGAAAGAAADVASSTAALSLFGHLDAMCPPSPQVKHFLSLASTFGARHSCDVWPFFKQFGHVLSRTSRGGLSRCCFAPAPPPRCCEPRWKRRRTKAQSSASPISAMARSSSSSNPSWPWASAASLSNMWTRPA